MFELKPISPDAIPAALSKAERYRLLNEPAEAASICEDVLRVMPDNQQALITLILSLTDHSDQPAVIRKARQLLRRVEGAYARLYYAGIIDERMARAYWRLNTPGCGVDAYELFREAMTRYEEAEALRPAGNDDALLRWNACARELNSHAELRPRAVETYEPSLDD